MDCLGSFTENVGLQRGVTEELEWCLARMTSRLNTHHLLTSCDAVLRPTESFLSLSSCLPWSLPLSSLSVYLCLFVPVLSSSLPFPLPLSLCPSPSLFPAFSFRPQPFTLSPTSPASCRPTHVSDSSFSLKRFSNHFC